MVKIDRRLTVLWGAVSSHADQLLTGCMIMIVVLIIAILCFQVIMHRRKTEELAQRKLLQEKSAVLEAAVSNAAISIWNYDFENNRLIHQEGTNGGHGEQAVLEGYPERMIREGFVHPDYAKAYRALVQKAMKSSGAVQGEFLLRELKSSNYWWERTILIPIRDKNRKLTKIILTSMDVTEQKEKELRYRSQIAAMQEMREENLVAKGRHNLSLNQVQYYYTQNTEFHLEEGSTYDQAVEALALIAVREEDAEKIRRCMDRRKLLGDFQSGSYEGFIDFAVRRKGGPAGFNHMKYTLFEDTDTEEIIVFIYSYDVTEHARENQIAGRLGSLEYELVALLDSERHSYQIRSFSAEADGVDISRSGDFDEMVARRVGTYVLPEERDALKKLLTVEWIKAELEKQAEHYVTYSIVDEQGRRRQKKLIFTYLDDTKTLILFCRSDITALYLKDQEQIHKIENALKEANEANQAKTEFFARMSHDLRTPMNGILGLADLSVEEEDAGELRQSMKKIRESGQYLLGLINDTLDFQRIESGKLTLEPRIVASDEILQNIVDMVKKTAEAKHIDFRINNINADVSWHIRIDPLRFQQIIINLLSNAVKFTPEGGTVEFGFQCLGREGMISHDCIIIRDTGIGMSEAFLKDGIFKPFSQEYNTVTGKYAGSGLGLSIVKNLVEMMGGKIEVKSRMGEGTEFKVYLDFERVDVETFDQKAQDHEAEQTNIRNILKNKNILLVEDHPLNAEIARKLLEKAGCTVDWQKNGSEGAERFRDANPHTFDAVLMDIRMPVMNGLEAARLIRSLKKEDAKTVPIIAMTANAYADDVKASLDAGMDAHLSKPVDPAKLYRTLAGLIGKTIETYPK